MNGEVINSLNGEQPGDKIIRLVNGYIGCSLLNEKDKLGDLIARGVDDPKQVVTIQTNCGLFALGILEIAGAQDPILNKKYVSGQAIAWVRQIAINLSALNKYTGKDGPQPKRGDLMHYFDVGKNNNHMEWCLSDPDENGVAEHGGGGRSNNAITKSTSSVYTNYYRPLQEIIDCDKLGIEIVPANSDENLAYPNT
jgi:hypothetical protein